MGGDDQGRRLCILRGRYRWFLDWGQFRFLCDFGCGFGLGFELSPKIGFGGLDSKNESSKILIKTPIFYWGLVIILVKFKKDDFLEYFLILSLIRLKFL